MSYTDINQHRGMNFGGINEDEIIHKLEITDPELIADVKGNNDFYTPDDDYNNYARSEIIDRTPDNTFLESDRTRRDPAISKSILNLRYNGSRGSNPNLPRHPELFIGFTGNDPRGADTQPRFDMMRGHATTRSLNLSARFQESNDGQISDRPWTGPNFVHGMKDLHNRLKGNTKVFTTEKTGLDPGRNIAVDEFFAVKSKRAVISGGNEGIFIPEQNQGLGNGAGTRVIESFSGHSRSEKPTHIALKKQWESVNDTDLEVNIFTPVDPSKTASMQVANTAKLSTHTHDSTPGSDEISAERNNKVLATLGAMMSMSLKRHTKQDADSTDSTISNDPKSSLGSHRIQNSSTKYHREDQDRRPDIQEDAMSGARGKLSNKFTDMSKAGMKQTGSQNHDVLMAGIETLLKKMPTPDTDQSKNSSQAIIELLNSETTTLSGGKSGPLLDTTRAVNSTDNTVVSAAASKGLEINVYSTAPLPQHGLPKTASTQMLSDGHMTNPEGKSKVPEFVGHGKSKSTVDNYFNVNGEVAGGHGPVGPKKLRAREHGDISMNDTVQD
jgi:hypothetical protein